MTNGIDFGIMRDEHPRKFFDHEAFKFTPWLLCNLDRISNVIGITLERGSREERVDRYAADIVAYDSLGGRKVLIENQLDVSDHKHLGQITTYLAGLDAQVVIWIAPAFNDPHIAAIRWLNENTVEPFAFFALRLRTVQIDESRPAIIFEIVEQPNNWQRQIQSRTDARALSAGAEAYRQFWLSLTAYNSIKFSWVNPNGRASQWDYSISENIAIAIWKRPSSLAIFIRHSIPSSRRSFDWIAENSVALEERLGVPPFSDERYPFLDECQFDPDRNDDWKRAADWLAPRLGVYRNAVEAVLHQAPLSGA